MHACMFIHNAMGTNLHAHPACMQGFEPRLQMVTRNYCQIFEAYMIWKGNDMSHFISIRIFTMQIH